MVKFKQQSLTNLLSPFVFAIVFLIANGVSYAQSSNLPYMMAFYNNPTGILEAQIAHCSNRHSHLSNTLNEAYGAWRQRNDPYLPLVRERMFNEFRKQRQNLQQILLNLRKVE